mgnify:CR=1 FL=1
MNLESMFNQYVSGLMFGLGMITAAVIVKTIAGSFDENRAIKLARFLKSCDQKETVVFEGQEYDHQN